MTDWSFLLKRIMHWTCMHKNQMYICPMYSSELIKGTLRTIILKLLHERDRMYGYEITQHVKEVTKGEIVLTEGALYPMLHKLEAEGMITTEKESIGKRVRKYYSLTRDGGNEAKQRVNEFMRFVETMRVLLNQPTQMNTWLS